MLERKFFMAFVPYGITPPIITPFSDDGSVNYEVLANIYKSRKGHRLDEWHTFCDWIETLPYSELITGKTEN